MADESVLFFNGLAIVITFLSLVIIWRAKSRFEKGEFRRIIDWIYYTAALFFLFQIIFNGLRYISNYDLNDMIGPNFVENYRALYSSVIALCFIKITYEIRRFSKVYGFAKVDSKFFRKK
jgi:hypothetical protein